MLRPHLRLYTALARKKDQLDASKYMAKLDDGYGLEEHEILPRQEEKRKGK